MHSLRSTRWSLGWALMATLAAGPLTAAESTTPYRGLRWQIADDEAQLLVPVVPRTTAGQNRIEALSWYSTGMLLESRNDLRGALNAYRKAVALDPKSIEIYRALIPLAMQLEQGEEAFKLAMKAVELDPSDHELLLAIGSQFARKGDFAGAIKYLDQAMKSEKLEKESQSYLKLNIELGLLYYAMEQREKAAECYTVVFAALKEPAKFGLDFRARSQLLADARTSYERVGTILMEGGKLELAAEAFEQAAKTNRTSAGNLTYNRAKLLLLSNKADEALPELQKYFDNQRQSKGRDAYQLLADIMKKLDRNDELVGKLETLADRDPRNQALQYFFAETLMQTNDLERAKTVYETALKGGGDAAGYLGLAGVLRRLKRADELLDTLGKSLQKIGGEGLEQFDVELQAVAADNALVDALMEAARKQSTAEPAQLTFEEAYLLAKIGEKLERFEQAIEFYRLAAKLDKDRAILAYRDLAEVLSDTKRYAEAAAVYEDGLKLRPPQQIKHAFYQGLAMCREMAGDTNGALAAIADARREFAGEPLLDFREAWIYYHSRQLDMAVPRFEGIIKGHPEHKLLVRQCQFSLSNIHVLKGEIRKGEEILEKVLEEEPDDPAVNNDLGYLYADQGKHLEKAESMIRKAVEAEPENAAYLDSLGWVLFKVNKIDEAVPHLEKAANKKEGGDGTIWDHLGDCYHRQGKLDKATDAFQKALKQAEAEKHPDVKLIERLKTKLQTDKPAKGNP